MAFTAEELSLAYHTYSTAAHREKCIDHSNPGEDVCPTIEAHCG